MHGGTLRLVLPYDLAIRPLSCIAVPVRYSLPYDLAIRQLSSIAVPGVWWVGVGNFKLW
jgi:hypothetical protein